MLKTLSLIVLFAIPVAAEMQATTDYANPAQREAWLRHPVYGDASFDAFVHHPKNPVHRGKAPHEWPVNGSLFEDPVSLDWFLFVGHYRTGYRRDEQNPSRATVYRSRDKGAHWEDLGPVFPAEEHTFQGEQSPQWYAPDVTVTYSDDRYHMSYDWATKSSTWDNAANPSADSNSGSAYAWANRPQGPYHRIAHPIATTREQPLLEGKYKRIYASTILQRENDWLVLTLTDSGPNFGWAYLGMTAKTPEGPYSDPELLLYPERSGFHPPLMEFHPSFIHHGFIYAPATSVALNRNFQMLWRVPIEDAMNPGAWTIYQHGSIWHADPVEHESYGIWGQTFSGFVDGDGIFNVMYPSRDSHGNGTINTASRPWDTPYRKQGVFISAHEGPSFLRLKRGGTLQQIAVTAEVHGTVTLVWNIKSPVGPNRPTSNASLHPLMLTDYAGVQLNEKAWTLLTVNARGETQTLAQGDLESSRPITCALVWEENEEARLNIHGEDVWSGPLPGNTAALGVLAAPFSNAYFEKFAVTGKSAPAHTTYLHTEALLGAAQTMAHWKETKSEDFRYGIGVVSNAPHAQAKWNVVGATATLWAPRGPDFGTAGIYLDGILLGKVDFHALTPEASQPLYTIPDLGNIPHAITLQNPEGAIPIDTLDVVH